MGVRFEVNEKEKQQVFSVGDDDFVFIEKEIEDNLTLVNIKHGTEVWVPYRHRSGLFRSFLQGDLIATRDEDLGKSKKGKLLHYAENEGEAYKGGFSIKLKAGDVFYTLKSSGKKAKD